MAWYLYKPWHCNTFPNDIARVDLQRPKTTAADRVPDRSFTIHHPNIIITLYNVMTCPCVTPNVITLSPDLVLHYYTVIPKRFGRMCRRSEWRPAGCGGVRMGPASQKLTPWRFNVHGVWRPHWARMRCSRPGYAYTTMYKNPRGMHRTNTRSLKRSIVVVLKSWRFDFGKSDTKKSDIEKSQIFESSISQSCLVNFWKKIKFHLGIA